MMRRRTADGGRRTARNVAQCNLRETTLALCLLRRLLGDWGPLRGQWESDCADWQGASLEAMLREWLRSGEKLYTAQWVVR